MIKKLKNFICKLFGVKQCACPEEMDPHEEMLYPKEPEKWKCGTHIRYKKSCPTCKELAGEI